MGRLEEDGHSKRWVHFSNVRRNEPTEWTHSLVLWTGGGWPHGRNNEEMDLVTTKYLSTRNPKDTFRIAAIPKPKTNPDCNPVKLTSCCFLSSQ